MPSPRHTPLFDPHATPASWNERMAPGEYAVHYSHLSGAGAEPFCDILPSLEAAEQHARTQVAARPELRCTLYDHHGFIGAPIRDIRGAAYKATGEISARFRRWAGSILFFGGLILTIIDWRVDFRYTWPAMIGTKMLLPGFVLLLTETVIVLYTRYRSHAPETSAR